MSTGSSIFSKQQSVHPHLVAGHGLSQEIADLRRDILAEFSSHAAIVVEEFTNVATADADGIKTVVASVAAITSYSGTALNGAVGAAVMNPPRNITVTTAGSTASDAPATALITGVDVNGAVITETITVAQTATIASGAKAFARVTAIDLPAADGTGATLTFGFGLIFGLAKPIKARAGASVLLKEIAAGSVVTNGTVVAAATGLPNGTYAPSTPPNDTNDYAIFYERDASV